MTNPDSILKSRDVTLLTKVLLVKAMVFPVVRYGCENWNKESWAPKNWCFWTMILEKTLECPLDYKEIQPVHSKGNQSWIFIRRTNAEAETPILWPPDAKNWLICNPEPTQTHVHWVGDAIQASHPLSSPSPALSFPALGSFPMS